MAKKEKPSLITHVVYDKKTGRIVHIHRRYNTLSNSYSECDRKEVINLVAKDKLTLMHVTDRNPKNLDMIVTSDIPDVGSFGRGFWFDTRSKKIVQMPQIQLQAEKIELIGDGKDSVAIEIAVRDSKGKMVNTYNGAVKVITNRGKLSTKAGIVKLKKGKGNINLTSVKETVDRVSVVARCMEERCITGDLDLKFV